MQEKPLFNREDYETFLIQNGCVRVGGKYILSSTKDFSPYHINFREFGTSGYSILLNMLGQYIKENIEDHQKYQFIGVPYGAIDIATQISTMVGNEKRAILRKEEIDADKEIDEIFAGPMNPNAGDEIVLIEDVLVKANNLSEYVKRVTERGILVKKAVILCNRRENASEKTSKVGMGSDFNREYLSAEEKLRKQGVELFILTDVHTLIPRAIKRRYQELDEKGTQIVFEILKYYGRNGFDMRGLDGKVCINEFMESPFAQENIPMGDYLDNALLQGFIREGVLTTK